MTKQEKIKQIKKDLKKSKGILKAISDENRQNILLVLLNNIETKGMKVPDIAKKVNLSRPAASHHMRILLDNKLVKIKKEGTKNYYHISGLDELSKIKELINDVEEYTKED